MQSRSLACFLNLALLGTCALAEDPIRFIAGKKLWVLDTNNSSYVFGVNEKNQLQHIYWGKRLWRDSDLSAAHSLHEWASFDGSASTTPGEYAGWGSNMYTEACLKITRQDGDGGLVLRYVSHEIRGDTLEVLTKDINDDIFANLYYRVYPAAGVIEKHAVIENKTSQPFTVESAQSGTWYMPPGSNYRLTYLNGRWAGETQLVQEEIHPGVKVLERLRGTTSHQTNPWFAIDAPQLNGVRAGQQHGRVWFGALGWSGSWRFSVEQTPHQQVRLTGGYNTFDFAYPLLPGESLRRRRSMGDFPTPDLAKPPAFCTASRENSFFPAAFPRSRGRFSTIPGKPPNSMWMNRASARSLKKPKIGVERFVMDDGWFGARNKITPVWEIGTSIRKSFRTG